MEIYKVPEDTGHENTLRNSRYLTVGHWDMVVPCREKGMECHKCHLHRKD